MVTKPIEDIVKALKEIVDNNGPNYLIDEPFQVYTELIRTGNADRKTAAALLHLLADYWKTLIPAMTRNCYLTRSEENVASISGWQTGLPLSYICFTRMTIEGSGTAKKKKD